MTATTASTPFSDRAPVELAQPVRMRILLAVMIGVFLAALDQTVVGTALPRIVTDLRGNELYTWAFTAYLLTSTISGPLYGKLSDLFGRRPIFLFGIGIFLVGSVLAGVSPSMSGSSPAAASRDSAPERCSRSRSPSSVTSSRRRSAASTRASSARSSACRSSSARPSAV